MTLRVVHLRHLVEMDTKLIIEEFVPWYIGSVVIAERLIVIDLKNPEDLRSPGDVLRVFWQKYVNEMLGRVQGDYRVRLSCGELVYPDFWIEDYLCRSELVLR